MSTYYASLKDLINLIIICEVLQNYFLNEIKYHKDAYIESI